MTERRPRILVLATGGTIAGQADVGSATRYTPGKIGIDALLVGAGNGLADMTVTGRAVAAIGSQDMNRRIWAQLHAEIEAAFASDLADGVVITHGTDTAEETAFLLDVTLPPGRPVVIASAMRPADAPDADGPRNLANAVRVAAAPHAHGRGVLIVMGDSVLEARNVYKAKTSGTDAFRAFPGGPIGVVNPRRLEFFRPCAPSRSTDVYRLPAPGSWPIVPILHAHADMDLAVVDAVLGTGLAGVVLAGVGHGNAPEPVLDRLSGAAVGGVAVVRSTRINGGSVGRDLEIDDDARHFLAGHTLGPQKCRLLLQLLVANGVADHAARQDAFARHGA